MDSNVLIWQGGHANPIEEVGEKLEEISSEHR